jgi:hypothetical protein
MYTTPQRLSYQARILVVPLGHSGDALVDAMAAAGLTNVQIVTDAGRSAVRTRDIQAARGSGITETVGDLVASSDMMVLLGQDLPEAPLDFAVAMAEAARSHGVLLAGVLVDPRDWGTDQGSVAMATLRRELDMLVTVRETPLATSFIDVLKGGRRRPEAESAALNAGGRP